MAPTSLVSALGAVNTNGTAKQEEYAMRIKVPPRRDKSCSPLAPAAPYVVGACSVIFTLISIFGSIELSGATAASESAASAEGVNRAAKADRLPLVPIFGRNIVNPPKGARAPDQKLFDGCEALASTLTRSPLAQLAGRCLS